MTTTKTIPLPPGAISADDWPSTTPEGEPARSVLWADLGTVEVTGTQYADDGRYEAGIAVYPPNGLMTAEQARDIAAKLAEAADLLDQVRGGNPYPVDSTYLSCCHAIGRHAQDCEPPFM